MSSGHKILTLNSGSSSLKFKLFELVSHVLKPIAWGVCERIGEIDSSRIKVGELQRHSYRTVVGSVLLEMFWALCMKWCSFDFRCTVMMGASMESIPRSQTILLP